VKVLIAGLGSIGQRHARNLRARCGDEVELIAYRRRGLPHVISERMTIDEGMSVERAYGIQSFDRLDHALEQRPDAVFICNPSSLHLSTALQAALAGCHLFIEKPLSHDEEGIDALIDAVDRSGRAATVGYQLRFHPALMRARQLLREQAIGSLLSVRAEFQEYLPNAHPYEDYRQSYAARAALGGGVILCYIHEVDYLYWLLGMPRRVRTSGGRLGDLDIDVEDTAVTTLEFLVDGRAVPVELRQSFLATQPSRRCVVTGTAGTIEVDLNEPSLVISTPSSTTRTTFDGFRRNQLFEHELENFLSAMAGDTAPAVPLRTAAQSLRIACAMRRSLATGQAVALDQ
jgi:predicted dehydrogenase